MATQTNMTGNTEIRTPIQDVVIQSIDVHRTFQVDDHKVYALRGANFYVKRGEYIALMGRSGSGKTTLLNIMGGLDRATSGKMVLFGQNLGDLSDEELTQLRRTQIGFVFQQFALMPTLSAEENVDLPLRMIDMPRKERHQRVAECLELVDLSDRAKHRPQELSGGQQQRVAIARAISAHPGLILADEPTGELDSTTGRTVMKTFATICETLGITIVMTSHDPVVQEFAGYTYHMEDGTIRNER